MSRYVPPLPPQVAQVWWYCLDCGSGCATEAEIRNHWRASHDGGLDREGENGVDYCRGSQFILMRHRYEQWIEEQAEHFLAEMYPGFGPEDFVAEAEIRE